MRGIVATWNSGKEGKIKQGKRMLYKREWGIKQRHFEFDFQFLL